MKFNLGLDNINYLKIIYKNTDNTTACTKAAIKRIGEKEIFACAKFEEGLYLNTPQEVSLSFVCINGLYRTNTTLKFIENEPPYIFFTLKTPEGFEYQQNREYFRIKMEENAILSYENTVLPCKTYDISASGVRLIIPENIENIDEVNIDLLFEPQNVRTKAKFIREDNEDGILKASFKFIDLPESSVDIISQKCIQKQLEYKRHNVNFS